MRLYGIALLPEAQTSERIIRFQHAHLEQLKGPRLSTDGFLPHTSILQCPYRADMLTGKVLDTCLDQWRLTANNVSRFEELYAQPVGWYFLGVERTNWMRLLQQKLLAVTADMIDQSQIVVPQTAAAYTPLELSNFTRYGYRYIGDAFRPHVTLGRNRDSELAELSDELMLAARQTFGGMCCRYSNIVFYEAGVDGALARVIESRSFATD